MPRMLSVADELDALDAPQWLRTTAREFGAIKRFVKIDIEELLLSSMLDPNRARDSLRSRLLDARPITKDVLTDWLELVSCTRRFSIVWGSSMVERGSMSCR